MRTMLQDTESLKNKAKIPSRNIESHSERERTTSMGRLHRKRGCLDGVGHTDGQRQAKKEGALEQESPCDALGASAVAQPVCAHQAGLWDRGRPMR